MSIKDFTEKIKPFWSDTKTKLSVIKSNIRIKEDLFIALLIVLVGLASFGLGKLSVLEAQKTPISITNQESVAYDAVENNASNQNNSIVQPVTTASTSTGQGTVFGSKSGTKYYYPWCSGANRIKPENRVWFPTIEAAKAAGLTPAANCPGLN